MLIGCAYVCELSHDQITLVGLIGILPSIGSYCGSAKVAQFNAEIE